jgi:L-2-hydroxyglutarate oxidase
VKPWDVTVVGGGILGTTVAYWLAARYEGRIALVEREADVARHTSRRNTGVIHRPFYLDPVRRRLFARTAGVSYRLWKAFAAAKGLPWKEIGTMEVATEPGQVRTLEKYRRWAAENGMAEDEVELLDGREVRRREPYVRCGAGLFVRTDTGVDFAAFTRALRADAEALGARFLLRAPVVGVRVRDDGLALRLAGRSEPIVTRFLVNCAGGEAVDIAHLVGVAEQYTDLHFRGEYWVVDPAHANMARTNLYAVPRHPEMPFLDPHWVVRADGRREIGPNAVPVSGPYAYDGLVGPLSEAVAKVFEPPLRNKARLLVSKDFLALATEEWLSSLSKSVMAERVRRFLPPLRDEHLLHRGTAGVRASVVDRDGAILKEALEFFGPSSYHLLNFNSPGATGAPAFAAYVVRRLEEGGHIAHLRGPRREGKAFWDFDGVLASIA